LGMVTPLYLASLLIERGNILERAWFRKQLSTVWLGDKVYPIYGANLVAAVAFLGTGILMLSLTFAGKLGMESDTPEVVGMIRVVAEWVTDATQSIPFVNVLFGVLLVGSLIWYVRRALADKENEGGVDQDEVDCCHKE